MRVPAAEIVHLFRPLRPGQIRGEPWLARALVKLNELDQYDDAELPNELTVVYTDWQTGGDTTVTVENLAAIQLQGGVINQRRDYPGVNYGPLAARLALRDLRALGSPRRG